jgi:hypothetical protein
MPRERLQANTINESPYFCGMNFGIRLFAARSRSANLLKFKAYSPPPRAKYRLLPLLLPASAYGRIAEIRSSDPSARSYVLVIEYHNQICKALRSEG